MIQHFEQKIKKIGPHPMDAGRRGTSNHFCLVCAQHSSTRCAVNFAINKYYFPFEVVRNTVWRVTCRMRSNEPFGQISAEKGWRTTAVAGGRIAGRRLNTCRQAIRLLATCLTKRLFGMNHRGTTCENGHTTPSKNEVYDTVGKGIQSFTINSIQSKYF
jgi:hypothetical protein